MSTSHRHDFGNPARAAGVAEDRDRFYECLRSVGQQAQALLLPLAIFVVKRFDSGPEGRWRIALDDSPTRRYGRHVEAANVRHNPTPGPADGPWLYGHNWDCQALLASHSLFGTLALPLLSRLYVRRVKVPRLRTRYDWTFRTKLELALELCQQVMKQLRALGSQAGFLVVFDGAYAARELIRPLVARGATVVTRLRRDAQLFDLPVTSGRCGRSSTPPLGQSRPPALACGSTSPTRPRNVPKRVSDGTTHRPRSRRNTRTSRASPVPRGVTHAAMKGDHLKCRHLRHAIENLAAQAAPTNAVVRKVRKARILGWPNTNLD